MTVSDRIVATIRTAVPALVGSVIAWAVAKVPTVGDVIAWLSGVIGQDATALAGLVVTAAVVAGYYALVRWAAQRWPGLEVLLGSKKAPALYAPPLSTEVQATVAGVVAASPAAVNAAQSVKDVTVQVTPGAVDDQAVATAAAVALAREINP